MNYCRAVKIMSAILCLLLILSSCISRTELKCSDIMASLLKNDHPQGNLYYGYGYENDSFTKDMMKKLYGIYDASEKCSDCALFISGSERIWEIHVFRLRSLYDVESVEKMLKRRIDMIKTEEVKEYSEQGYVLTVESARMYTKMNIVCLLITDNNREYISKLSKIIK